MLLGVSVYLLDRDWATVLFLAPFGSLQPELEMGFGRLGFQLPSFFHAYGFALLIILMLRGLRHAWLFGAAGWFAVAASLEALQAEAVGNFLIATQHLVGNAPFAHALEAYAVNGSFDTRDILAAAIGCLAAGVVAHMMEVPR